MRKVGVLALGIALAVVAAACGGAKGGSPAANAGTNKPSATPAATGNAADDISGTVRLSLVGWQLDDGLDAVSGKKTIGFKTFVKETFEKKFPKVKLEITNAPFDSGKEKQQAMLLTDEVDVMYTGGSWATEWYKQGLLRSIDDLIQGDSSFKTSDFVDGIFDGYTVKSLDNKNIFGIPSRPGKRMIVYDKKLFDQWGVEYLSQTPSPEEVLTKAKKMTGKNPVTGEQNYGLWATGNSRMIAHYLALTYAYNAKGVQGSLADVKNLKWELNTPEMAKVLEWLKEAAPLMPKAFVNGGGAENFGLEKNKIAIQLDGGGSATISEYKAKGNKELLDRFVPVYNLGPKGAAWMVVDPFVMAKNAKNLKASWEVMKFLASYERQKYSYQNFGWPPVLKNPDFLESYDWYAKTTMELLAVSPQKRLMDESNLFYASDISPAINGFMSQAANGNAPDIQKFLDDLQNRAVKWSAAQK
ncbi:extracellular solute-binding protein [Paenibacillus cymbidii]|uniref:extracellular solute-binding protein n=1 Tax=Paenibacillus cymbidii TaxID=1639034 RepID=UPI0010821EF2|nr:extracellular solute-binding protein [Paenibacillus cymbidii]